MISMSEEKCCSYPDGSHIFVLQSLTSKRESSPVDLYHEWRIDKVPDAQSLLEMMLR